MPKSQIVRLTATRTRLLIHSTKLINKPKRICRQQKHLPLSCDNFEQNYEQVQFSMNSRIKDAIATLKELQSVVAIVDDYRNLPAGQHRLQPKQIMNVPSWHEYDLKVSQVLNYTNEALATLAKPMALIKKWLCLLRDKSSRSSLAELERSVKSVDSMMAKLIILDCERQHGRYNAYIMRRLHLYQTLGAEEMRRQDFELFLHTLCDAAQLKKHLEAMCHEITKFCARFCKQALRISWRIDS